MTKNFELIEIGLYDHVEYNERDVPVKLVPTSLPISGTGEGFTKTLVMRIKGKPGSYWGVVRWIAPAGVKMDVPELPGSIKIAASGTSPISIEIPFNDPFIPGSYRLEVWVAGEHIGGMQIELRQA